ncbi:response regulator [Azonexus sp.]|uniref:response regulator n=1 Tax=Azonexus sp. TaxID=1872668 RepID=UPI0039E6CAFE
MGILDQLKSLFGNTPNLPLQPTTTQPDTPAKAAERRHGERVDACMGTRAIIIDDSKTICTVLRKFLRSAGYETIECLDAEHGLHALQQHGADVVFLDIMLPGMNGFAALRAIRRDVATRNIPVIMMSGNEQAIEQFFGTRIGADDFMKKPFSRQEVFFRMTRLLDATGVPRRTLLAANAASGTTASSNAAPRLMRAS